MPITIMAIKQQTAMLTLTGIILPKSEKTMINNNLKNRLNITTSLTIMTQV